MVLVLLALLFINPLYANCLYKPPFKKGSTHRIIQSFNGTYSHQPPFQYGIDFEMPSGTLILASRSGVIKEVVIHNTQSGKSSQYLDKANKIIIDHLDGTFALYAHLEPNSARVKIGQEVSQGLPLARSGCTGWCDGPHLHFEVFKKKKSSRKSLEFKFDLKSGCSLPKLNSQITNEILKRR